MSASQPPKPRDYEELLSPPEPPRLASWIKHATRRNLILVGSPLVTFVLSVGVWTSPNPSVSLVFKLCLILPVLAIARVAIGYGLALHRYDLEIRERHARLREIVLAAAGLRGAGNLADLRFAIRGIAEHEGTVQLVLDKAASVLRSGVILAVVSSRTLDEWGTVEVLGAVEGLVRAAPVDRRRPEFWENLEDRMKTDPSPPEGFHLEPQGLRELYERLKG